MSKREKIELSFYVLLFPVAVLIDGSTAVAVAVIQSLFIVAFIWERKP